MYDCFCRVRHKPKVCISRHFHFLPLKKMNYNKCPAMPFSTKSKQIYVYIYIYLVWPPPCTSHHQDFSIFSRGFLLTFTFHCYREGAISNIYIYIYMGVSQNEAAGTGSLSQGSVSRVCFVVCFGGLFRGSVSHSSSTSHS